MMANIRRRPPVSSCIPGADRSDCSTRPDRVVVVGAGAGGLEAIQLFFAAMPADGNFAFVVCRELQPDLADPLAELLRGHTSMPIRKADDGTMLEANSIYLMPSRVRMILVKDRLISFEDDADGRAVAPLDLFLHALAASAEARSIAVILSGAGCDGLRGAVSVRRAGGLVLAQSPDSAESAAMPAAVIDAGLASAAAPPEAMADLIRGYVATGEIIPSTDGTASAGESALADIFGRLRGRFGLDLDAYRLTMVARRIRRRAALANAPDLEIYARLLADDSAELERLHDDLLIAVTTFFRDQDAFAALGDKVVPKLLRRMSAERPIRIWVPACATGEEAYSLAILMLDDLKRQGRPCHLQITGTDRQRRSLEQARLGRYPRERLRAVPPALIERCFDDHGNHLQIRAEVQALVTFAEHDLITDRPPAGMDLVSCRNLLIYLTPPSRQKALQACCRALAAEGFLFLGPSELPGPLQDDLAPIDSKWRIYRKAGLALPKAPAHQLLPKLHARRPAEVIPPPAHRRQAVPMLPGRIAEDQPGAFEGMIEQNQQMLESTIDTLLASNDALRRRNRDLRSENQRLTAANAALDEVATVVAHDLKAPLRAVDHLILRVEAGLRPAGGEGAPEEDLQHAQLRLAGMRRLIDDLLIYACQGARDDANDEPVNIGDLVRDVLTVIGLPPGFRIEVRPPSLSVRTWRIPLECIFRNLLGNALRHHRGAAGSVRIEMMPTGEMLDVKLTDDGQGLVCQTEGVGLCIVRRLLAAHGRELALAAAPAGQGTEARFTWPIVPVS